MERIEALGLASRLSHLTQPVLGICLGMQLLFERSEEEGIACLGLVPGQVRKLAPAPRRPVPHMGWSKLSVGSAEPGLGDGDRSEEHTSELQSLMRISYAVFCLKKQKKTDIVQ